jgi:hypothetical protein
MNHQVSTGGAPELDRWPAQPLRTLLLDSERLVYMMP